ncbi:MAG: hypothetical protein HN685_02320 [Waddliaceae bacterium]|nr:hypothetical protein [Waddliaceae bacterium]
MVALVEGASSIGGPPTRTPPPPPPSTPPSTPPPPIPQETPIAIPASIRRLLNMRPLAKESCYLAYSVGATVLVATAFSSPVGAAGGAVLGGVGYLANKPISSIFRKVFKLHKQSVRISPRAIGVLAANVFAIAGVYSGISSLLGYSITFGSALLLSTAECIAALTTIVATAALALIVIGVAACGYKIYQAQTQKQTLQGIEQHIQHIQHIE